MLQTWQTSQGEKKKASKHIQDVASSFQILERIPAHVETGQRKPQMRLYPSQRVTVHHVWQTPSPFSPPPLFSFFFAVPA